MDPHYIHEFIIVMMRELSRKRLAAVFVFCATALALLVAGMFWPLKYETNATLYVDERNIIEPLLEGQATVQQADQAREAREKIYTRQILEKVARDAGLLGESPDAKEIAGVLAMLGGGAMGGGGIQIDNSGQNYIRVAYQDANPETSFNVITALINAFIRNIAESKRQKSKEAYDFIASQVEIYKEQLKVAEERLKAFNANNRDGTEENVRQRIEELRSQIETLNLTIDEIRSRRNTIQTQLQNERAYLSVRTRADVYRQRLQEDQSRLQNMLVHLTETHPDVISLRQQIDDHRAAIRRIELEASLPGTNNQQDLPLNPLFEELRSNLSEAEIALNAAVHRQRSLNKLLAEEYERAERIASRKAELTELNRDYSVTRNLYEEMLNSQEKARLTMTLDIEGQGTSYKVHEPPTFPLNPVGLNAKHFLLIAPLAGILIPLGIIGAFVFLDPRIRLPSDLALIDHCELLTTTPPLRNSTVSHGVKKENILAALLLIVSLAAFGWIAVTKVLGVA